jgi:transposase
MAKGRAVAVVLDEAERGELTALTRKHGAPQALAERARIILAAASGLNNKEIAAKVGVCAATAGTWRNRFAENRMDGLYDEPRPGAPREIGDDEIASTIRKTLETLPKGATHWSLRTMAREIGHAPSTVHRIWRAFGLQPHRSETFKLSSDPLFVEKLPMRPGQVERRTHDYKRHGTTSLFAALNVKAGTVIGKCMTRHRTQEFRKFLDEVERNVPADLDIHVVMDNYGTHKTKLIRNWFAKRARWHVHFTPTSASWLNQVERFFALLTERTIKRGVFSSVHQLEIAIKTYIEATNADPKPFRWTKTADDILASIQRFCLRTIPANA